MIDTLFVAIEIACALVILAAAVDQLNHMTHGTPHIWRAAQCALACGATGLILQPAWTPHPPTAFEIILIAGFAMSSIADRRGRRQPWRHDDRQVAG